MKRILITAAAAILAAALLAPIGSAADKGKHKGKRTYTTKLKGSNEVPGPGDPDGKGKATIRLDSKRDRVCFTIETKRIAPPDKGHIHVGDRTTAGPVFITLFTTASNKRVRHGCVAATDAQIDAIRANPANYYVNVHNATFPNGALRGQLRRSGR
jgi:hypothetical protein